MTLEQLEYQIGEIALKNNLVNAYFAGGSLYELNAEVINEYPVIFLTPAGDHTVKENTTRFSLTIYYVDRLWDDDRNETDICSAAIETLKNIMRQINYLDWVAYVEDEPVIRLFTETERMNDRVAGAYMNVWVEVLNASTCPEFLDELGRPMGNYIPGNINVLDAYATKAWVILQKYADKPWVLEQIANIQLSGGTTQKQVLEMIASALTEYTKTENFATINSSAITNGGDFQLVERSEFDNYSALTSEEFERIIQMINDIDTSGITSSITENITILSANTEVIKESLSALSAYTLETISSITQDIESLSASTVNLSEIITNIRNGMDVVLDYNVVSAMTVQERIDLYNAIRGYDVKRKVWFLVRRNNDTETQFVPIFGRKSNYIDFVGYSNVGMYTAIYLYADGTLEKKELPVYNLPAATSEVRGGVKIGSGLTMVGDTLFAEPGVSSSVTEEITILSSITSSHTEEIITLSANTSALTENMTVLSAFTHESVSSITNNLTTLSAVTESAVSGLPVIYDYSEWRAADNTGKLAMRVAWTNDFNSGKNVYLKAITTNNATVLLKLEQLGIYDQFRYASDAYVCHVSINGAIVVGAGEKVSITNILTSIPTASNSTKGGIKVGLGLVMSGEALRTQYQIWTGTQSEYDALSSHDSMTFYVITDLT